MFRKALSFLGGLTFLLIIVGVLVAGTYYATSGPVVYKVYPNGEVVDVVVYINGQKIHRSPDEWLKDHKGNYEVVWVDSNYLKK